MVPVVGDPIAVASSASDFMQAAKTGDGKGMANAAVGGVVGAVAGGEGKLAEKLIAETLSKTGNFLSKFVAKAGDLLEAGEKFLGGSSKEIGKPGSGVFRSTVDPTRQFRIDKGSLAGTHPPNIPHGHLEVIDPATNEVISNNHIPFVDK